MEKEKTYPYKIPTSPSVIKVIKLKIHIIIMNKTPNKHYDHALGVWKFLCAISRKLHLTSAQTSREMKIIKYLVEHRWSGREGTCMRRT